MRTFGKDISSLQREGWITTDNALTSEHDAAHVQWGGGWRLPTDKEMKALNNNCNWMWTTTNGVDGYVVSGRGHYASASIFLPYDDKGTDGFGGYYWSSVPCSDRQYSWGLYFNFSAHLTGSYGPRRYDGCPVRPVQGFTK